MAFSPGFSEAEAKILMEICQQTYDNTPGDPPSHTKCIPPVPKPQGWSRVDDLTPTDTTLLDNYWEVWQDDSASNRYAVAVRGTVETPSSIFVDLFLPLIRARADLEVGPITLPFHLARAEPGSEVVSGVHAGFALSLLLMLLTTDAPLLGTLSGFGDGDEVYITGHSQGASIALLMTSLVGHSTELFKGPSYKSYAFAPAQPGNDHYSYDLAALVGLPGFCYSVANTQGWVPQVPLTLQGPWDINTPNPLYKYKHTLNPAVPEELAALIHDVETGVKDVLDAVEKELEKLFGKLTGKLAAANPRVKATDLGFEGQDFTLGSADLSGLLRQIIDLVLPSLNYTFAGTMVPLFGTPGGNPCDNGQFDPFWQHHLGNYIKLLEAQYG